MGVIEVWFSSDSSASGGMEIGREWRENLEDCLRECHFVLAIQTPSSAGRPWIMWECGLASGVSRERGIIPIVYGMGLGDLANPLHTFQAYPGERPEKMSEVCRRLTEKAGLRPPDHVFETPIKAYLEAVALHRPRKALRAEQMELWRNRFEELMRTGRDHEVRAARDLMYTSLGKPFQPVEPAMHELLSRILLDQKENELAVEEVDYALRVARTTCSFSIERRSLSLNCTTWRAPSA